MILQALNARYGRLAEQGSPDAPPFGFGPAPLHFAMIFDREGVIVDVQDLRVRTGRKVLAAEMIVPKDFEDRTSGDSAPRAFWDNAEYVLGVGADKDRAERRRANFRRRQERLLTAYEAEPAVSAFLALLKTASPIGPYRYQEEFTEKTNVCFRLTGDRHFLHDLPCVKKAWAAELAGRNTIGQDCLVTGSAAPAARIHPLIKGIAKPGEPTPKLVSFDKDTTAFDSFGKKQGGNAPVGEAVAFAYSTALNALLSQSSRQKLRIGDASTVYWAEADGTGSADNAELAVQLMLEPVDPAQADAAETDELRRKVMDLLVKGMPLEQPDLKLDPATPFYILGLAPNAARLSVRFWEMTSLGALGKAFHQHWQDLRMELRGSQRLPSIAALALRTAPARRDASGNMKYSFDDVSPLLAGELTRAILSGGRYPASLLSTLVMRIRTDGHVDRLRIALIKACIVRTMRLEKRLLDNNPEYLMSTDPHDAIRRLGRLFALLEQAQYESLGEVNSSFADKYLGSAAATPSRVFPSILELARKHYRRMQKGHSDRVNRAGQKRGPETAKKVGHRIGRRIEDLVAALQSFPSQLSIEEQGLFLIGFYQERSEERQRAADAAAKAKAAKGASNGPTGNDDDDEFEDIENQE